MELSTLSRWGLSKLPVEICLGGRKMRAVQVVMDRLTRESPLLDSFSTPYGNFQIDPRHPPQRVLAYCFYNILNHYKRSPLGQRILSKDWDGKTFVDVGANLGMYSLIARSAGADSYAFEPEPAHAEFLRRNRELLGNIFPIALSDSVGELPLFYSPGNSGATSLVSSPGYVESTETIEISTFSLQDLGDKDRIELVKIDVEGNELLTIRGMRDFLDQGHRPEIWCEVRGGMASRSRNSAVDVIEAVKPYGYRYCATDGTSLTFDRKSVFDLLFLPR